MMHRKNHFRCIIVSLEDCAHAGRIPTSLYRLSAVTVAALLAHATRCGVWCHVCGANAQPKRFLRTERL